MDDDIVMELPPVEALIAGDLHTADVVVALGRARLSASEFRRALSWCAPPDCCMVATAGVTQDEYVSIPLSISNYMRDMGYSVGTSVTDIHATACRTCRAVCGLSYGVICV